MVHGTRRTCPASFTVAMSPRLGASLSGTPCAALKLPGTARAPPCCGGWRSFSEYYLCDPCDLLSMSFKVDRLGYHPDRTT